MSINFEVGLAGGKKGFDFSCPLSSPRLLHITHRKGFLELLMVMMYY